MNNGAAEYILTGEQVIYSYRVDITDHEGNPVGWMQFRSAEGYIAFMAAAKAGRVDMQVKISR